MANKSTRRVNTFDSGAIELSGEKEFFKLLKVLDQRLARRIIEGALKKSAKPIVKEAKENLRKHDRTGKTRRSVKAKRLKRSGAEGATGLGQKEVTIGIGATKDRNFIGRFLEFGTSKQPARPWLRPALDQHREKQQRVLAEEIKKRTLKEANKLARKALRGG